MWEMRKSEKAKNGIDERWDADANGGDLPGAIANDSPAITARF
jgi:hypothetical protein